MLCALVFLAGCDKPVVPQPDPQLPVTFTNTSGDWVLDTWEGNDMSSAQIYLRLKNKEFVMWQSVNSMYPVKYTGTYNITEIEGTGFVIRGMYDYTYEYWQHQYVISSLTSDTMEWTSLDNPADVSVYRRTDAFPKE